MVDDTNSALLPIEPDKLDINLYHDIRSTLAEARAKLYSAVNSVMDDAYWDIGQ